MLALFIDASTRFVSVGPPQRLLVRKESAPAQLLRRRSVAFFDNISGTGGAVQPKITDTQHSGGKAVTPGQGTAVAIHLLDPLRAGEFPSASAWQQALPLRFSADWQGKNSDLERETEVRLLWTPQTLYLRFGAKFRSITVFPDAEPSGRRDQLWDRDVAEAFLQADATHPRRYREFEVSPNGFWIDLDIAPDEKRDLKSGLTRRVNLDDIHKIWTAELAIPMRSLVQDFDPSAAWRVNFYRVEGPSEPRFYSAWRPTGTPRPNFHVPEAFGTLIFRDANPRK